MRDADGVVPFCPSDKQVLAEPEIIRRAGCMEFSRLLFDYATLKDRDAFHIIRWLHSTLNWAFRIERRIYIRRSLTCSKQDIPVYQANLQLWDGPGPTATEDF